MSRTNIVIGVVALVVILVLVTSQPKTPAKTLTTGGSTSNASFFNLGAGLAGFLSKVTAPTPTPSLQQSSDAAARAVAAGKPVSQTSGNDLITLDELQAMNLTTV